jgi:hypothetical protein
MPFPILRLTALKKPLKAYRQASAWE